MKMKQVNRSSVLLVFIALALVVSLGFLGCSNALGSKPASNQANLVSVEVTGAGGSAGARALMDEAAVTEVRVSAFDSANTFLVATTLTKNGTTNWKGTINLGGASGTILYRVYARDMVTNVGKFYYYGETTSASTTSVTIPTSAYVSLRQAAVPLNTAGNFRILAETGITTTTGTGSTAVTGDIGLNAAASTNLTGFGESTASHPTYATSGLVTGNIYASDYAAPTPATLTSAVSDKGTAYTYASAAARNPEVTELGSGEIGGLIIKPGCFKWATTVAITNDVTLDGTASDVWIFQIGSSLSMAANKKVNLVGGATADHVFWAVGGQTTLVGGAQMKGVILDATGVAMQDTASVNGRIFAGTAVTMIANAVGP